MQKSKVNIWWGPPKQFSNQFEDRKISWLELFYDLVYVIAISRITHHLSDHLNWSGFLDYTYLFGMIFWGWLNGSLHHDIHGSTGVRTNLMTLWQMLIISALVVTLNTFSATTLVPITIALMAMQVFITYLWWSVGIYDKVHRKLNVPYTLCYLASLACIAVTLFLKQPFIRPFFYLSLLLNYLPPFLIHRNLKERGGEFSLSSSMTERLGLFTIILFGEVVLGIITGASQLKEFNLQVWINFTLAILIAFSLWWIFFSMIADRKCKPGFLKGNWMAVAYIPTLMALGMTGVAYGGLFSSYENTEDPHAYWIRIAFGSSIAVFLLGVVLLSSLLDYPETHRKAKGRIQQLLVTAALLVSVITVCHFNISLAMHLLITLLILLAVISVISKKWFLLAFPTS
jgi:low temperature requirement protein LtrA